MIFLVPAPAKGVKEGAFRKERRRDKKSERQCV
jgi:hypothetical protein